MIVSCDYIFHTEVIKMTDGTMNEMNICYDIDIPFHLQWSYLDSSLNIMKLLRVLVSWRFASVSTVTKLTVLLHIPLRLASPPPQILHVNFHIVFSFMH